MAGDDIAAQLKGKIDISFGEVDFFRIFILLTETESADFTADGKYFKPFVPAEIDDFFPLGGRKVNKPFPGTDCIELNSVCPGFRRGCDGVKKRHSEPL